MQVLIILYFRQSGNIKRKSLIMYTFHVFKFVSYDDFIDKPN
jgi:hypothetical protein